MNMKLSKTAMTASSGNLELETLKIQNDENALLANADVLNIAETKTTEELSNEIWVDRMFTILRRNTNHCLVTLQIVYLILKELLYTSDSNTPPRLTDKQAKLLQETYDNCVASLKEVAPKFMGDILLLFEDEIKTYKPVNFDQLVTDPTMLLPITKTNMQQINLARRLPASDLERIRKSVQLFILLREIKYNLLMEKDRLPLNSSQTYLIKVSEPVSLERQVYHVCKLFGPNGQFLTRYLIVVENQLLIAEPAPENIAIVKYALPLETAEVSTLKLDSGRKTLQIKDNITRKAELVMFDDDSLYDIVKSELEFSKQDLRKLKVAQLTSMLSE